MTGRFEFDDYDDPGYANGAELFSHSVRLALAGKRGRKLLSDLRDALMHLPERRLTMGAFCRIKPEAAMVVERFEPSDFEVCAVGAFAWWQKVKKGVDPVEAFESLPTLEDESPFETAWAGKAAGLTPALAWELASANDETWSDLTPEARFERFVSWIDELLAAPEWHRGDPLPERIGRSWATGL